MSGSFATGLLWLFVIFLGIAFGAGLYERRIAVPRWIGSAGRERRWDADAARQDDTGRRFWAFVTTGLLTLLTIANLIVAWSASGPVRAWWLTAAIFALAERLFTFAYFIPTMVALMKAPSTEESTAKAVRWASLSYLRLIIGLVAWLSALNAFALLQRSHI